MRPPIPHIDITRLRVPDGVQPEAYFAGLFVSALFGVTAGTLLFLTGVLFVRTSGMVSHPNDYTIAGRLFFHPEHETYFFIGGCAIGVGVVLAHALLWNRRLGRGDPPAPSRGPAWIGSAVAVLLAGAASAGGVAAFFLGRGHVIRGEPIPGYVLVVLLLDVAFCLVAGAVGLPARFSWSPGIAGGASSGTGAGPRRRHRSVLDLLVPVSLFAVLLVPAFRLAAGRVYHFEQFFHWDFFAMGPTLAYSHGQSLGALVHSEYGMGWPMVFSALKPVVSISYGHMILISSVVACVYYIGAYLLLRAVTRRAGWAAVGVLLAVLLQMFSGNYVFPGTTVHAAAWELPSVLVLRRPLDVWVFLALVMHLRTGRRSWAVAGGVLTGLAVLFSTDTGLFLAAGYLLYWVCVATTPAPRKLRAFAASATAALATLLVGMGIGSHWTLFSTSFWKAWWEPIRMGAQGYTALPIVGRFDLWRYGLPDRRSLALFVAVVMLYLALVCHLVIKLVHRRAAPTDIFLGCVSAYGLLALVSFLGRSDPVELPHLYVPFALVAATLAGEVHERLGRRARPGVSRVALALTPVLAFGGLGVALAFNTNFREYPGPLQTIGSWSRPDGICLMTRPRDVCGLPAADTPLVDQYRAVTADMRRLSATGRVAVLDYQAEYNVGTGIAPSGPYVPLLDNLFLLDQARSADARFVKERPTFVFLRFVAQDPAYITDVATGFRALLQLSYTLDHSVGPFEVWKAR